MASLQALVRKKKKIYMIVGLKVADKAIVYHEWDAKKGGGASDGSGDAFVQLNVDGKVMRGTYMRDREKIYSPFIYAYQLRACINDGHAAFKFRPNYERRAGNLFALQSISQKTLPFREWNQIRIRA